MTVTKDMECAFQINKAFLAFTLLLPDDLLPGHSAPERASRLCSLMHLQVCLPGYPHSVLDQFSGACSTCPSYLFSSVPTSAQDRMQGLTLSSHTVLGTCQGADVCSSIEAETPRASLRSPRGAWSRCGMGCSKIATCPLHWFGQLTFS